MSLTGVGIAGGTYIESIDALNLRLRISANTTANGGGTAAANAVSVQTRIVIEGDGEGAIAEPRLLGNTIEKITLDNIRNKFHFCKHYNLWHRNRSFGQSNPFT
jgi:hypothetical protein